MTEIKDDKPNPGSDEAVDAGCLCPVMDNRRGKGAYLGKNDMFWINAECPLHAKKPKDKLRVEIKTVVAK